MKSILFDEQIIRPIYFLFPIFVYYFIEYLRRLRKFYYSPLYFPFVFESLNPKFAAFYGTNTMQGFVDFSDEELRKLENSIRLNAAVSGFLSGYLIPIIIGFICAPLLKSPEFYLALAVITGLRIYEISRMMLDYDVRRTDFGDKRIFIIIIGIIYVASVYYFSSKGFDIGSELVKKNNFRAYSSGVLESILMTVGWQSIIFPLISTVAVSSLLNRKMRSQKEYEVREFYNHQFEKDQSK